MTNDNDEFRNWAGPITGDEVQEINHLVINKVIEACGDTPFKNFDPRDGGDWTAQEHRPDLKSRRLFPTNGLRDANRLATTLERASANRSDLKSLRMLTLRLKGERPAFGVLDAHLEELSNEASKIADDIKRRTKEHPNGLARPILTAIHIRVADEGAGHFDPHIHGIWHIADQDIEAVERKLREKFGQVWIDTEPVRSLKRSAYYIAQGIIDYRRLPVWPDAAIKAVWDMGKMRMVRKAGWFGNEGQPESLMADEEDIGPESAKDAPGGRSGSSGEDHHMVATIAPPGGILEVNAGLEAVPAWKGQLFPFMRPYRPSVSVPNYTVRPPSSEYVDITRYPTLGDIQTAAIALIESEQRDNGRSATEVFAAYKLDKEQVATAIARTEAYFHITLFHPGTGWVPTPHGVKWAVDAMAALKLLGEAADVGKSELMGSYRDDQRLPDHLRRK